MNQIIIRETNSYDEEFLSSFVDEVFDSFNISFNRKKVFVKPNMLGAFRPEKGVTTHPALVKAVVQSVKARGASRVMVGDNPGVGGYGMVNKVAKITGIGRAAGNSYVNMGENGIRVKAGDEPVTVSREILDADIVINLPKFKTHSLTVITGAVKNTFGYLLGAEKARAHFRYKNPERFSEFLAEVMAVKVPDLTIVDGIVGMEGNGPSAGELRHVGKLIAGRDPVAVDSFIAHMMGVDPRSLKMLARAESLSLGKVPDEKTLSSIPVLHKFKLPVTSKIGGKIIGRLVNSLGFYLISRRVPVLIREKCSKCKICRDACPTGAIKMVNGYPEVDYNKCISCFCCHEQCPSASWNLKLKLF